MRTDGGGGVATVLAGDGRHHRLAVAGAQPAQHEPLHVGRLPTPLPDHGQGLIGHSPDDPADHGALGTPSRRAAVEAQVGQVPGVDSPVARPEGVGRSQHGSLDGDRFVSDSLRPQCRPGAACARPVLRFSSLPVSLAHAQILAREWDSPTTHRRQNASPNAGRRLHRALSPEARFGFINVAEWESPQHFQAAVTTAEFAEMTKGGPPSHPSLYEVVRTIEAGAS